MGTNNIDYSTLTVTNVAQVVSTAASPAMVSQAKGAMMSVETAPIRWRDDGTAPTSTEGHLLMPGDILNFNSWTVPYQNWKEVLRAIQVIRTGTDNGLLKISWYD